MDDEILLEIHESMPKFNTHLISKFTEDSINDIPEYLSKVYKEVSKFLKNKIEYKGYRILSPEERVSHELSKKLIGATTVKYDLKLVAYNFEFNKQNFSFYVYLPYLVDNQITYKGAKYFLMYGITEKIFSKTNQNTLTMRVIRQPINFYRNPKYRFKSVTSDKSISDFIVVPKLHQNRIAKSPKESALITIPHYFIVRFGFNGALSRFGITPDEVSFVNNVDEKEIDRYEFFEARQGKYANKSDMVYMKVHKSVLEDIIKTKFVVNVLYLLYQTNKHPNAEDLYEENGIRFSKYMGKTFFPSQLEGKALAQIDLHILSTDILLDSITQYRLSKFNINVNDIWDMIQYVFENIDYYISNSAPQNTYDKRMTVVDPLIIELFITPMYNRIYTMNQDLDGPNVKTNRIVRNLNFRYNQFNDLSKIQNIDTTMSSIYNGNGLLSFLGKCVTLTSKKNKGSNISQSSDDIKFHPSALVIKSMIGYIGNGVEKATLNPYSQIDEIGNVIEPQEDYIKDMINLSDILPY